MGYLTYLGSLTSMLTGSNSACCCVSLGKAVSHVLNTNDCFNLIVIVVKLDGSQF